MYVCMENYISLQSLLCDFRFLSDTTEITKISTYNESLCQVTDVRFVLMVSSENPATIIPTSAVQSALVTATQVCAISSRCLIHYFATISGECALNHQLNILGAEQQCEPFRPPLTLLLVAIQTEKNETKHVCSNKTNRLFHVQRSSHLNYKCSSVHQDLYLSYRVVGVSTNL